MYYNGWIKYFSDGDIEEGYDFMVVNKLASFSKGRLDGISCLEMHHNNIVIAIGGTGNFWQSDTYEASVFGDSELVERTIYKQIGLHDKSITIQHGVARFYNLPTGDILFSENDIDKWFALSMKCGSPNKVSWRIVDSIWHNTSTSSLVQ